MSYKELVRRLSDQSALEREHIAGLLNMVANMVASELSFGGEIKIADLGTFRKRETKARTGRNPHTGEAIPIPAKARVKFTPSKSLKEAVL